jgi:hypothetical protein
LKRSDLNIAIIAMLKSQDNKQSDVDPEPGVAELGLDVITDVDAGASIPRVVKQNAFKAFGRLCSAVIIREQVNLDMVSEEAARELQRGPESEQRRCW